MIPARRPAGPQRGAVMDKEAAVFSIVGVQGQPQQAPRLPFRLQGHQPVADVQERLLQDARADGDNLDQAGLVGDKETAAAVIGGRQGQGGGEALGYRCQPHRQGGRRRGFAERLPAIDGHRRGRRRGRRRLRRAVDRGRRRGRRGAGHKRWCRGRLGGGRDARLRWRRDQGGPLDGRGRPGAAGQQQGDKEKGEEKGCRDRTHKYITQNQVG